MTTTAKICGLTSPATLDAARARLLSACAA